MYVRAIGGYKIPQIILGTQILVYQMNKFGYASRKCIEGEKIIAIFVRKAFAEIGY